MGYYRKTKVYSDGNHYIAIPHTTRPMRRKRLVNSSKDSCLAKSTDDKKEAFERLYEDNKGIKRKERIEKIFEEMKPYFKDETEATEYVAKSMERKTRNKIYRKIRLWRKVNLQEWNFFATFTFDSKKHTEETFKKSLSNCLKHLSSRKGWKYIGAWERSPEKKRLHFHCLLYVPDGSMTGEIVETNDYDTVGHRRQKTYQNSYFSEKYGRNDFKPICKFDVSEAVNYLVKYLEKDGGKLTFSRGLPQYIETDIMSEDVVCPIGIDDRKLLLFDDFNCWLDGELIGKVSPEVKDELLKRK